MVHMVERFYVLGSRVARLALFHRLGESPARASRRRNESPFLHACPTRPPWPTRPSRFSSASPCGRAAGQRPLSLRRTMYSTHAYFALTMLVDF